eukprot:798498-Prymnesium_polylepis.1
MISQCVTSPCPAYSVFSLSGGTIRLCAFAARPRLCVFTPPTDCLHPHTSSSVFSQREGPLEGCPHPYAWDVMDNFSALLNNTFLNNTLANSTSYVRLEESNWLAGLPVESRPRQAPCRT